MSETVCVRKRGEDIARLCVTESINMRVRQKAGVCVVWRTKCAFVRARCVSKHVRVLVRLCACVSVSTNGENETT